MRVKTDKLAVCAAFALALGCGSGAKAADQATEVALPAPPSATAEGTVRPPRPESASEAKTVALPLSASPATEAARAAEIAFSQGRALVAQGQFNAACQKFEESLRLDFALGTLMNLADCKERDGDTAKACQIWGVVESKARGTQDTRASFAQARRQQLQCP